jgi:hypothetical protein
VDSPTNLCKSKSTNGLLETTIIQRLPLIVMKSVRIPLAGPSTRL